MKLFKLEIFNIQHIKNLTFDIDLSKNQLMCIVGKNGVGKTTLFRSIKNITSADTFIKTASPHIFKSDSRILYTVDKNKYDFKYDSKQEVIDTKSIIDKAIKDSIYVELPIPHGERFNHFQKLGQIDEELRTNIFFKKYTKPDELIKFLSNIYRSNRFDNLKQISVKNRKYYFILKEDGFYIREDYLSSGEHFIINLYKIMQNKCKLIVIDEIDISLDASAQVNLVTELRKFCEKFRVNIIFTTHSLALMKTLKYDEAYYMENNSSVVSLKEVSYNYIRSELFCFKERWDKYILVEDIVLEQYITHLIVENTPPPFFNYKVIYIGGSGNVIDLMKRNKIFHFFSSPDHVISILDGDKEEECKGDESVFFIPFESVEKQLSKHYRNESRDGLPEVIETCESTKKGKIIKGLYDDFIFEGYQHSAIMTNTQIFDFINERKKDKVEEFKNKLIDFLNP